MTEHRKIERDSSEHDASSRQKGRTISACLVLVGSSWITWSYLPNQTPDLPSMVPVVATRPFDDPATRPRNAELGVAYVGDAACARCHTEIAETFARHPMGRSMVVPDRVKPEVAGEVFSLGGLRYRIERRGDQVVHQEQRLDASGKATANVEGIVRYVIGSGTRGYSFLVERGDKLHQSPIAWYTQGEKWDLAPGYQSQNLHFDREITDGCLFCHTNRMQKVAGKPPVFHGLAIGCERCHGPGTLHVNDPGPASSDRPNIVNPAKLDKKRRENVCEQCHLQGGERVETYAGSSNDYRPGLSLERFLTVLSAGPPPPGPGPRNRAVGHVEQMRTSRCYRESQGELGCISCHDPHRLPDPAERIAYYRGRCLECHADKGCSLARETRLVQSPGDDCAGCHVAASQLSNIAHTAGTDHSIPRRPR